MIDCNEADIEQCSNLQPICCVRATVLGLPTKFPIKVVFNLETDMNKLVERNDVKTDVNISTGSYTLTNSPVLLYNPIV